MLVPFRDYNEFVDYCEKHYEVENGEKYKIIRNYKLTEDSSPLYLLQFHYMSIYKKSKNIFKRLIGKKVFDKNNSIYGHLLSPILEIETFCPLIEKVDIKYRDLLTKQIYSARVNPQEIYYYE